MTRKPFARGNPLALAVLTLLYERPMHPYQMSQTLQQRGKQESVRLNFGSLYSVVDSLVRQGLIEPTGTEQDGNRPARTVYELTATGVTEVLGWLRQLISEPVKEFPQFMAALSFMPLLAPDECVGLLRARATAVRGRIADIDASVTEAARFLPELFVIETKYELAMARAELDYTTALADQIETGAIGGGDFWRRLHELRADYPDGRLPPAVFDSFIAEMGVPGPPTN